MTATDSATNAEITAALSAPFERSEVKFKPQQVKNNKALALAYVDARVIQDRLDDVLGIDGWSDTYELLPEGSAICTLRCRIGEEWITKMDVGSPSEQPDAGDRVKAAFSDALKRTAVKFGVGRYLYRLPAQWVDYDPARRQFVRPPALPDDPRQTERRDPPQPAKPPTKPSAPAPTRPAAKEPPPLPRNGEELLERLTAWESNLVDAGRCKPGELMMYLANAAAKAQKPGDMAHWAEAEIKWAVDVCKMFAKSHPAGQ